MKRVLILALALSTSCTGMSAGREGRIRWDSVFLIDANAGTCNELYYLNGRLALRDVPVKYCEGKKIPLK